MATTGGLVVVALAVAALVRWELVAVSEGEILLLDHPIFHHRRRLVFSSRSVMKSSDVQPLLKVL